MERPRRLGTRGATTPEHAFTVVLVALAIISCLVMLTPQLQRHFKFTGMVLYVFGGGSVSSLDDYDFTSGPPGTSTPANPQEINVGPPPQPPGMVHTTGDPLQGSGANPSSSPGASGDNIHTSTTSPVAASPANGDSNNLTPQPGVVPANSGTPVVALPISK